MITALKNFFSIYLLAIVCIVIYSLVMRGVWENPTALSMKDSINIPLRPYGIAPDRGRFLLTQNLVEHQSFALNREQADVASPDVGYYNGNWFLFYAPGVSILAMPFYVLGLQYNLSQVFTYLMISLFAIANLILIFLISRDVVKLPYWASIFASLVFGFASISLSYASSLYQHHPTTFFILFSFYASWQYKQHQTWGFLAGILIWLSYGIIIFLDYPNAILMLPVMVYFAVNAIKIHHTDSAYHFSLRPSLILTSFLFVTIMILHGYYNQVNFGSWKTVSGSLVSINLIDKQQLDLSVLSQDTQKYIADKSPVGFFKETHLVGSSYELLVAPDKGLLIFSPIYILGFLGIVILLKQNKVTLEIGTLMALIIVNIFFYSSWGDPWGGWAFGPRYIIPAMAILPIFISLFLTEFKRFAFVGRFLAFVLFGISSAIALLGALTTNAVPPKTEADYLKIKYGFLFNLDFLEQGITNSFAYNYFFHNNLSIIDYYSIVLSFILFIAFIVLFFLPLFEMRRSKE